MGAPPVAACDSTKRRNLNRGHGFLRFMLAAAVIILATAVHHVEGDGAGRTASRDRSQPDNPLEWQAKWITADRTDKDPLPIFRKSIRLGKPVRQATVHICGLGHYELSINGRRVGDHEMDPGWTNYRKTCLYSSYDVTNMLEPGDNAIGVMLGNGMYNVPGGRYTKFKGTFGPPKLICQMHVVFGDGSTEVLGSDETWKYALGPIVFTCIYGGEDYDARREQPGWDQPGFDDGAWSAAKVCDGPGGKLVAQYAPPVKVADYLPAVAFQRLKEGEYEADCGINLSARPVIKVKGSAGSQVVIRVAEKRGEPWTHDGGHVYTCTLKGEGEEVFRPRFTYFSFQYLYISGADRPEDVKGGGQRPVLLEAGSEFLTSSAPAVGGFECSNALFNDINAMIDRSVRSNLQSVLTDCPHREKLGWLEVAHLMGPSILYHRDVRGLYQKICRDTTEAQLDNGLVPDIAPEYTRFQGGFFESPEWGSACVQLPNLLYTWYGDRVTEEQQYETMQRYTQYLASTRDGQGLVKPGLGDWYDWTLEKGHAGASQLTPAALPATAFLYDNACILTRVAKRLGRNADAAKFQTLAERVRQDFIKAYYKPAEHSVATGSQASLALALYFGLVPDEDRDDVLANLVAELEKAQYRQSTGEVCFRMLVQALADGGRSDVVYRMINRTDAPGYGHMLKLGFRTLSERWDKPGSSMNHCMYGHIQEWFQNSLVGIRQTPDSAGFEHLLLRPEPVGDLTSVSGHYGSVRGRIESRWRIENGRFLWHISVPPTADAEVHVPAIDAGQVTEGGRPVDRAKGVVFVRMEPGRAVFKVGPGRYEFQSPVTVHGKAEFIKAEKQRVIVLTDISNEPDDEESLVRFLVYSNEYDVEGLIATTSVWLKGTVRPERIQERVEAYGQVRDNLLKHASGYPTKEHLLSVIKAGRPEFGMDGVGEGKSSEGSRHIIAVVDELDTRPVWVCVWGGANCLAQVMWDVKHTRSEQELDAFVSKLRVYTISDQDNSGHWLRITFPNLFYIVSPSSVDNQEYHKATWTGISGDRLYKNGPMHRFELVDNPWLEKNIIEGHGLLGALYPRLKYIMEGDTPSFFNLIDSGLGSHISPSYGGWGGRYVLHQAYGEARSIWTNTRDSRDTVVAEDGKTWTCDQATIWRWREAYQHDFAARMDWCVADTFEKANHNPIAAFQGNTSKAVAQLRAKSGEQVPLSAAGTHDPDGNEVSYRWFIYEEAGTFKGSVEIEDSTSPEARLVVPQVEEPKSLHVILEVKDDGQPPLFSYRRVIITAVP